MAQGVFQSIVSKQPYEGLISNIDSCGTGAYHVGSNPDSRTMSTLEDHGIADYKHTARKIHTSDFEKFDFIFAMDRDNRMALPCLYAVTASPAQVDATNPKNHAVHDLQYIQRRVGSKARAKVMLFGSFSGRKHSEEISDPYYGARDGFDVAYEQCVRFSKNFLTQTFPQAKP